jgi:tetratricopeptide (TPR) repeat protein
MLEPYLELHKQGRLDEAEAGYRQALVANPDDAEAHHLLAIVRRQRGDLGEALLHAGRAVELGPDRPNYLMTLAGLEFHGRRFDDAAVHFQTALGYDPNRADAYSALGHIALLRGDLAQAEQRFLTAMRIGDERPEVLSGYGNTLLAKGDPERAVKYLSRAVDMAPGNAGMLAQLGRAHLERGHFAFAIQAMKRALDLDGTQAIVRLMLAEAERRSGNLAGAEDALRPLLDGPPGDRCLGHTARGELAQARGDFATADLEYRRALEADPPNPRAVEARIRFDLMMGQPEDALATLDAAITAAAAPVDLLRRKAQLLAMLDRHVDGARTLEAAAAHREDPEILCDLATARALAGDYTAAEDAAAQVGDGLGRISTQARIVGARAALERGDDAAAQAVLARIDRDAQDPEQRRAIAAFQAAIDDRLDRVDRALEGWIEAHQAYPGNPPPPLQAVSADALKDAIDAARAASHPIVARRPAALLLGSPGSGVELIAALLSDQPGIALRNDRFGADPRRDWIGDPESIAHLPLDDIETLERLARRFVRPLDRVPSDPARMMIDWLPTFDSRALPAMHAVFGEIKLIIVGRDPRDALLHWIGLGGAHRYRAADPVAAASWLRLALDHLAHAVKIGRLKLLAIDSDRLAADPPRTISALGQFLELPQLAPGSNFQRVMRAASGLPSRLPPGRWKAYSPLLDAAFAKL